MIIPDISLLIYAHNDQAPQHGKANAWWEGLPNGRISVGLPWISISGSIRLRGMDGWRPSGTPRSLAVRIPLPASEVERLIDEIEEIRAFGGEGFGGGFAGEGG